MNPIMKTVAAPLAALALAVGAFSVTTATPAEAGRGGRIAAGVAGAVIGLGVLGAIANAHGRDRYYERTYVRECYPGPEHCGYAPRRCFYNDYGDYICPRREWRCWRERICD